MGRFAALILSLGGLALLGAGIYWLVYTLARKAREARERYETSRKPQSSPPAA